ncbi:MAG: hypothetical protein D6762_07250 [Candidatus Neomarinimicrobiota bacterium]|nr:MAG: hypothetical protein D6762_07250 [Candidatus Neomarinimicrobiota bacterium]
MPRFLFTTLTLILISCSLWEYEDPSQPLANQPPETYLSLLARDTLYAAVSHVDTTVDPATGATVYDTTWTYDFSGQPDPGMVWDTLEHAFTTITTSRQWLHWWGEDPDGNVIGYYYRWSTDQGWTYTTDEEGLFFVPIQTDLDVFRFQVKAMDQDSLIDETPAELVLPIRNSPPEVSFRYRSNPLLADLPGDTNYTFPTRTFVWDIYDQDGIESVISVYYALDDTCDSCWTTLDAASYSSVTLTGLEPGAHTFYLMVEDIAGARSPIISYPDSTNPDEAHVWVVKPVVGQVLLVDDFPQDQENKALSWYRTILDTVVGADQYSVWEIGDALPFSATDVTANLNYFSSVLWFSAYTQKETYLEASSSITSYVMSGGNFFIDAPDLKDSTFTWFPLQSSTVLNPSGRLFPGRRLISDIRPDLDLEISQLIAIRVKSFVPDSSAFEILRGLYHMAEPQSGDAWTGTPTVASLGQFRVSPTTLSGKIVLMSLPIHNGIRPIMEGNGSAGAFISYLLREEFQP